MKTETDGSGRCGPAPLTGMPRQHPWTALGKYGSFLRKLRAAGAHAEVLRGLLTADLRVSRLFIS